MGGYLLEVELAQEVSATNSATPFSLNSSTKQSSLAIHLYTAQADKDRL